MKLHTVILAAILTVIPIYADQPPTQWCNRPGEPCSKAKRDALALAEAVAKARRAADADPDPVLDLYLPDSPYLKAKRDLLDAEEALAEAEFTLKTRTVEVDKDVEKRDPARQWCHLPGEPCSKMKRIAEATADAISQPVARHHKKKPKLMWSLHKPGEIEPPSTFCYYTGEPCSKARRAIEEVSSIISEPEPHAKRELTSRHRTAWCSHPGEPCSKAKRALETRHRTAWCSQPGEPCSKHKRALESLRESLEKL